MLINALFAFLHFAAAFGIVAAIVYQRLTFNRNLGWRDACMMQRSDRWYGIFAGMILAVGLCRVYFFEKGSEFYFSSPFFRVKLALFLSIGLISIYPTVTYLSWRKDTAHNRPPVISDRQFAAISAILNLELILLLALMLSASLMAKGIGR